MLEDISAFQTQPPREWIIRAIGAFSSIPALQEPTTAIRYAAYGLRVLHTAAYEFPDLHATVFDLCAELDDAILKSAPKICDAAPRDITKERVYICLGAASSLARAPRDELDQQLMLAGYLRARLEAHVLWIEVQKRGDTIMRKASAADAFKYARFDGGWLH